MDQQNNSAKFAFYYMLSLVALIFLAVSAGTIIFQIINKEIVDVLGRGRGMFAHGPLKFAISAIIISAPIYYFVMRQIHKSLFSGALARDAGVRKWLTYFILFVASVVMLGWLIATINNFLNGELTLKFILKSLTSILIAAAIFVLYYYDIKREEVAGKKSRVISAYFYGSLVFILAVFAASLFYVESPQATRNRLFDSQILENFNLIDGAMQSYYTNRGKLPESLDKLKSDYQYIRDDQLADPVTGENFSYKIVDDKAYELCAVFRTSNKIENSERYDYYDFRDAWPHDAGYQCLKRVVQDLNAGLKPVPVAGD